MYKLMKAISVFVRLLYVPNPFDSLRNEVVITIWETPVPLSPEVLNWVAEPFMHAVTYAVVRGYYKPRSAPALGSFLYLVFYWIHTLLFCLASASGFAIWVIVLIGVIYVGCHMALNRIRDMLIM